MAVFFGDEAVIYHMIVEAIVAVCLSDEAAVFHTGVSSNGGIPQRSPL